MDAKLIWVTPDLEELVGDSIEGLEVVKIPESPTDDSRLGDVRLVVLGSGGASLIEILSKMGKLEVIQTSSAGVNNLVDQIPKGVKLCSARGAYGVVAEWVAAAVLSAYKEFSYFRDEQQASRWSKHVVRRVIGTTILLVGYGGIAQAVEERLNPFGANFLRVARTARPGVQTLAALPALVPQADVVVLLVPLTSETEGLVGSDFLARMKRGALLVNAARGKIVDTDALIVACESGRISAVIDVTEPEPLPEGHRLFSTPNVFITPHVAGGPTARPEVLAFLRAQLGRFARGEELENAVTNGY